MDAFAHARRLWAAAPGRHEVAAMGVELPRLAPRPSVSALIAVSETHEAWLRATVDSLAGQVYPPVEVCLLPDSDAPPWLSDYATLAGADAPFAVLLLPAAGEPVGVRALGAVPSLEGQYAILLDPGDVLEPDALFSMVSALPPEGASIVYADEDAIDEAGVRNRPVRKPPWSPALTTARPYTGRPCLLARRDLAKLGSAAHPREGDLVRGLARAGSGFVHVPAILCHRRSAIAAP